MAVSAAAAVVAGLAPFAIWRKILQVLPDSTLLSWARSARTRCGSPPSSPPVGLGQVDLGGVVRDGAVLGDQTHGRLTGVGRIHAQAASWLADLAGTARSEPPTNDGMTSVESGLRHSASGTRRAWWPGPGCHPWPWERRRRPLPSRCRRSRRFAGRHGGVLLGLVTGWGRPCCTS